MKHPARAPLVITLLAAALAACSIKTEVIGNTFTTDEDADSDGMTTAATTTGSASATSTSDGMTSLLSDTQATTADTSTSDGMTSLLSDTQATTTAEPNPYGEPCEVPEVQVTILLEDPLCAGGICLLAHDEIPPSCEDDDACARSPDHEHCAENGLCNLSSAYIADHARCTQTCEDVDDCPPIPGCESGPACGVIALLGDLCCQKVCVCADEVSPATLDEHEQECAQSENCGA